MNHDPTYPHSEGQPPVPPSPPGEPPSVIPVRYMAPPPAPPPRRSAGWLLPLLLIGAVLGLMCLGLALIPGLKSFGGGTTTLTEEFHSGDRSADDKIAIIQIEGVIMDGLNAYALKQIEAAAKDKNVKGVVLRIHSPGGSISASDDLYQRLIHLRDNTTPGQRSNTKSMVVSMGGVAASGGYYIAMPAQIIFAERTSLTGSIGVYAAFPNIAKFSETYGITMNIIKAGDVKDSGSMFHVMTPQERQVWQDMVNDAYDQFLQVVNDGRGDKLKKKLTEPLFEKQIPDVGADGKEILDSDGKVKMVPYVRKLADGGIFTAQQAKEYGLIDEIGYLENAVIAAKKLIDPSQPDKAYRVITYQKPKTLVDLFVGGQTSETSATPFDAQRLADTATPRLWYLVPQSELSGLLSVLGR